MMLNILIFLYTRFRRWQVEQWLEGKGVLIGN
jgi:hypothetical protein